MIPDKTAEILSAVHAQKTGGIPDTAVRGGGYIVDHKTTVAAPAEPRSLTLPLVDQAHVRRSGMGAAETRSDVAHVGAMPSSSLTPASPMVSAMQTPASVDPQRTDTGLRYLINGQPVQVELSGQALSLRLPTISGQEVPLGNPEDVRSHLLSDGSTISSSSGGLSNLTPEQIKRITASIGANEVNQRLAHEIHRVFRDSGRDSSVGEMTQKLKDDQHKDKKYASLERTYTKDGRLLLEARPLTGYTSVASIARDRANDAYKDWHENSGPLEGKATRADINELQQMRMSRKKQFEYGFEPSKGIMRVFTLSDGRKFSEPIIPGKISTDKNLTTSVDNFSGVLFPGDLAQSEDELIKFLGNPSYHRDASGKTILEAHSDAMRTFMDNHLDQILPMIGDNRQPPREARSGAMTRESGISGEEGASSKTPLMEEQGKSDFALLLDEIAGKRTSIDLGMQAILETISSPTTPLDLPAVFQAIEKLGSTVFPETQKIEEETIGVLQKRELQEKLQAIKFSGGKPVQLDDLISPAVDSDGNSLPGSLLANMSTHGFIGKAAANPGVRHPLSSVAAIEAQAYGIGRISKGLTALDAAKARIDPGNLKKEKDFAEKLKASVQRAMEAAVLKYRSDTQQTISIPALSQKRTLPVDVATKFHKKQLFSALQMQLTPGVDVEKHAMRRPQDQGSEEDGKPQNIRLVPFVLLKDVTREKFLAQVSSSIFSPAEADNFDKKLNDAYDNFSKAKKNMQTVPGADSEAAVANARQAIEGVLKENLVLNDNEKQSIENIIKKDASPYIDRVKKALPKAVFDSWLSNVKNGDLLGAVRIMQDRLDASPAKTASQQKIKENLASCTEQLRNDVSYYIRSEGEQSKTPTGLFSPRIIREESQRFTPYEDSTNAALFRKAHRQSLLGLDSTLLDPQSFDDDKNPEMAKFIDENPHVALDSREIVNSWFSESLLNNVREQFLSYSTQPKNQSNIILQSTSAAEEARSIIDHMRKMIDYEGEFPLGVRTDDPKSDHPWHDAEWHRRYAVPGTAYKEDFSKTGEFATGPDGSFVRKKINVKKDKVPDKKTGELKLWAPTTQPTADPQGRMRYEINKEDDISFQPEKSLLTARDSNGLMIPVGLPNALDATQLQGYYPNPTWQGLARIPDAVSRSYAGPILTTMYGITADTSFSRHVDSPISITDLTNKLDESMNTLKKDIDTYYAREKTRQPSDPWNQARSDMIDMRRATTVGPVSSNILKKIVSVLSVNNGEIMKAIEEKQSTGEDEKFDFNLLSGLNRQLADAIPSYFYPGDGKEQGKDAAWVKTALDTKAYLLKKYMSPESPPSPDMWKEISLASAGQLVADAEKRIQFINELQSNPQLQSEIDTAINAAKVEVDRARATSRQQQLARQPLDISTHSDDVLNRCRAENVMVFDLSSSLYPDQMRGSGSPVAFYALGDSSAIESHNMIHIASDPLAVRYNPSATLNEAGEAIELVSRLLLSRKSGDSSANAGLPLRTRDQHRKDHVQSMIGEMKKIYDMSSGDKNPMYDIINEINPHLPKELKLDKDHFDTPGWEKRFLASLDFYCEKHGISMITPADEHYPSRLLAMPESWQFKTEQGSLMAHVPKMIFVKGNIEKFKEKNFDLSRTVACIGTAKLRQNDPLDAEVGNIARNAVEQLAKDKWIIVSGMAKGIDSICHGQALDSKTATIGILPHGITSAPEGQQLELYNRMTDPKGMGVVMTEYLPGMKNYGSTEGSSVKQNLHRNRLQAGLSIATIMFSSTARQNWIKDNMNEFQIQANENGVLTEKDTEDAGSMATLRHSLYQGRRNFVLDPASMVDSTGKSMYKDMDLSKGIMTGNFEAMENLNATGFQASETLKLITDLNTAFGARDKPKRTFIGDGANAERVLTNLGLTQSPGETPESFLDRVTSQIMKKTLEKDADTRAVLQKISNSYNPDGTKKAIVIHAPDENDASLKQLFMARAMGIPTVVVPSKVNYSKTKMPDEYDENGELTRINSLKDWAPLKPDNIHAKKDELEAELAGTTFKFGSAEAIYYASLYKDSEDIHDIAVLSEKTQGIRAIQDKVKRDQEAGRILELTPDQKVSRMYDALKIKFSNKNYAAVLAKTGNATIVHESPDAFWGVIGDSSPKNQASIGTGANVIGKLLMFIREQQKFNRNTLTPNEATSMHSAQENCQIPWNKALPFFGMYAQDVDQSKITPLNNEPLRVGITGSREGLTTSMIEAALRGSLQMNSGRNLIAQNGAAAPTVLSAFERRLGVGAQAVTTNSATKKITPLSFVHGGAKGADSEAINYILANKQRFSVDDIENSIMEIPFDAMSSGNADFLGQDGTAGYRRNSKIVANSDVLIAIWDGKSRGTMHAVMTAIQQGKPVHLWSPDGKGGMKLQEIYPSSKGNMSVVSPSDPSPTENSTLSVAQDENPTHVRKSTLNLAEKLRTQTLTLGVSHDSPYMKGIRGDLINSVRPKSVSVMYSPDPSSAQQESAEFESPRGHYLGDHELFHGRIHKGVKRYNDRALPVDSPDSWESFSSFEQKTPLQTRIDKLAQQQARQAEVDATSLGGAKDKAVSIPGMEAIAMAIRSSNTASRYASVASQNPSAETSSWLDEYNDANPKFFSPESDSGKRMAKTLSRSIVVKNNLFPDLFARVSISFADNESLASSRNQREFNQAAAKFHVMLFHKSGTPTNPLVVPVGSLVYEVPTSPPLTNISASRTSAGKGVFGEGYVNYQRVIGMLATDVASNLLASHQAASIHQELSRHASGLSALLTNNARFLELKKKGRARTTEENAEMQSLEASRKKLGTIGIPLTTAPQSHGLATLRARQEDKLGDFIHTHLPVTKLVSGLQNLAGGTVTDRLVDAKDLSQYDPIRIPIDQIVEYIDGLRAHTQSSGARQAWPPAPEAESTGQSARRSRQLSANPNIRFQASHQLRGSSTQSGMLMLFKALGGEVKALKDHIFLDNDRAIYGTTNRLNGLAGIGGSSSLKLNVNAVALLFGSLLWEKKSPTEVYAGLKNPETNILHELLNVDSNAQSNKYDDQLMTLLQGGKIFGSLKNKPGMSNEDFQESVVFQKNMSDVQLWHDIQIADLFSKTTAVSGKLNGVATDILAAIGGGKTLMDGKYTRDGVPARPVAISLATRWSMFRDNLFWMGRDANFSSGSSALTNNVQKRIGDAAKLFESTAPALLLAGHVAENPDAFADMNNPLAEKMRTVLKEMMSKGGKGSRSLYETLSELKDSISRAKANFVFLENIRHDGNTEMIKMRPLHSEKGVQKDPLAISIKKSLGISNSDTLLALPAYLSSAFDLIASLDISFGAVERKIGFESTIANISKSNIPSSSSETEAKDTKFVFVPGSVWQATKMPFDGMKDAQGNLVVPNKLNPTAYALVASRHQEINRIFFGLTGGRSSDENLIEEKDLFSSDQKNEPQDRSASHYVYIGTPMGKQIGEGLGALSDEEKERMSEYQKSVAIAIGHAANIKGATRSSSNSQWVLPSDLTAFKVLQSEKRDIFEKIALDAISEGAQGSLSSEKDLRDRQIRALVWSRMYINAIHDAKRDGVIQSAEGSSPSPYTVHAPSKSLFKDFGDDDKNLAQECMFIKIRALQDASIDSTNEALSYGTVVPASVQTPVPPISDSNSISSMTTRIFLLQQEVQNVHRALQMPLLNRETKQALQEKKKELTDTLSRQVAVRVATIRASMTTEELTTVEDKKKTLDTMDIEMNDKKEWNDFDDAVDSAEKLRNVDPENPDFFTEITHSPDVLDIDFSDQDSIDQAASALEQGTLYLLKAAPVLKAYKDTLTQLKSDEEYPIPSYTLENSLAGDGKKNISYFQWYENLDEHQQSDSQKNLMARYVALLEGSLQRQFFINEQLRRATGDEQRFTVSRMSEYFHESSLLSKRVKDRNALIDQLTPNESILLGSPQKSTSRESLLGELTVDTISTRQLKGINKAGKSIKDATSGELVIPVTDVLIDLMTYHWKPVNVDLNTNILGELFSWGSPLFTYLKKNNDQSLFCIDATSGSSISFSSSLLKKRDEIVADIAITKEMVMGGKLTAREMSASEQKLTRLETDKQRVVDALNDENTKTNLIEKAFNAFRLEARQAYQCISSGSTRFAGKLSLDFWKDQFIDLKAQRAIQIQAATGEPSKPFRKPAWPQSERRQMKPTAEQRSSTMMESTQVIAATDFPPLKPESFVSWATELSGGQEDPAAQMESFKTRLRKSFGIVYHVPKTRAPKPPPRQAQLHKSGRVVFRSKGR
jgi:predicted NAD-dependent protein-ADP-ribosyltransferase YbiA (DUF1768 family)